MPQIASKLTTVTLDSARVISTGSIRVSSILVTNGTADSVAVLFYDNDSNLKLTIYVPTEQSFSWDVVWLADNGLNIENLGDGDVVVTVAHGADGS